MRGLKRPNVSSCGLVITLHGSVHGDEESRAIEEAVGRVPGVQGVENKLVRVGGGASEKVYTRQRLFSRPPSWVVRSHHR